MRPLCDMDTIQIEITNACLRSCSNCTRFCGHQEPFFLTGEYFKEAVDSMVGYPKMTGFMGGEPLLHPNFKEFCEYAASKIPKKQLGLWTCLPKGYEHYNEIICETFGHLFINDHSRNDIYHCPILVGIEEICEDKNQMWYAIDHCWIQNYWSAAINPKGAFFCEIAASMSLLFDGNKGWKVEPGWWWRIPKDFGSQMEEYCPKCGAAAPLKRRASIETVDDISPKNLERLKESSRKVYKNLYVVSDFKIYQEQPPMGAYKETAWRQRIADRYNIHLEGNELGFLTPFLKRKGQELYCEGSLFEYYKQLGGN